MNVDFVSHIAGFAVRISGLEGACTILVSPTGAIIGAIDEDLVGPQEDYFTRTTMIANEEGRLLAANQPVLGERGLALGAKVDGLLKAFNERGVIADE